MVSGAFTLTDTMRGAADSLSSSAYDGTDAVVSAARRSTSTRPTGRPSARRSMPSCSTRVRAVPQVAVAVGDISDEAKIVGRDGKPVGDGPYFGSGYDSRTAGAQATTPFRLDSGRWATGAGRGRHRRRDGREAALRARLARPHHHARRGAPVRRRGHRPLRQREVARHGDRRRVRPARRAVAVRQGRPLRLDPRRRPRRRLRPPTSARPSPPRSAPPLRCRPPRPTTASRSKGLEQFISIIRTVLLVFGFVAIFVGAFTIFNTLSITVAQRSREFGLLRMVGADAPAGPRLGDARGAGDRPARLGRRPRASASASPRAWTRSSSSMDLSLPDAGMVFASRTVDRARCSSARS